MGKDKKSDENKLLYDTFHLIQEIGEGGMGRVLEVKADRKSKGFGFFLASSIAWQEAMDHKEIAPIREDIANLNKDIQDLAEEEADLMDAGDEKTARDVRSGIDELHKELNIMVEKLKKRQQFYIDKRKSQITEVDSDKMIEHLKKLGLDYPDDDIFAMKQTLVDDLDSKVRLQDDFKSLKLLFRHQNIPSVYDVGDDYYVMEYIKGTVDADTIIAHSGQEQQSYNNIDRINIVIEAAKAIEHAHMFGVIHRDIKPDNIAVDENGKVKLIDFGLAKSLESEGETRTGYAMGTAYFMCPEQIRSAKEATPTFDIYALGATLYHYLTGERPYEKARNKYTGKIKEPQSSQDVFLTVCNRVYEPISPSEIAQGIPRVLDDMILKAIAKERAMRYQSVTEFIEDLVGYLNLADGDTLNSGSFFSVESKQVKMKVRRRRRHSKSKEPFWTVLTPKQKIAIGSTAAGVILILFIILLSSGNGEEKREKTSTKTEVSDEIETEQLFEIALSARRRNRYEYLNNIKLFEDVIEKDEGTVYLLKALDKIKELKKELESKKKEILADLKKKAGVHISRNDFDSAIKIYTDYEDILNEETYRERSEIAKEIIKKRDAFKYGIDEEKARIRHMFGQAVQYGEDHPLEFQETIYRFKTVAKKAAGTEFEEKARSMISELENRQKEKESEIFAKLEKEANKYAENDDFDRAAKVYTEYDGVLWEETREKRIIKAEWITKRKDEKEKYEWMIRGMYEHAELWTQEHPYDYQESIKLFESVVEKGGVSDYEIIAGDRIKELKKEQNAKVGQIFSKLKRESKYLSHKDFESAVRVYTEYDGILQKETYKKRIIKAQELINGKMTNLDEMYETAERSITEHPDEFRKNIALLETIRDYGKGTEFEIKAKGNLWELRNMQRKKEDEIFARLDREADKYIQNTDFENSIRIYEEYNGALQEETREKRIKKTEWIRKKMETRLFFGNNASKINYKKKNCTLKNGILRLIPPSYNPIGFDVHRGTIQLEYEARFETKTEMILYLKGVDTSGVAKNIRLVWHNDGTLQLFSTDTELTTFTEEKDKRRSGCDWQKFFFVISHNHLKAVWAGIPFYRGSIPKKRYANEIGFEAHGSDDDFIEVRKAVCRSIQKDQNLLQVRRRWYCRPEYKERGYDNFKLTSGELKNKDGKASYICRNIELNEMCEFEFDYTMEGNYWSFIIDGRQRQIECWFDKNTEGNGNVRIVIDGEDIKVFSDEAPIGSSGQEGIHIRVMETDGSPSLKEKEYIRFGADEGTSLTISNLKYRLLE